MTKSNLMASILCAALSARAATYYWNPSVASGNWSDMSNWCTDSAGKTPATDYPRTSSDTASFIAGTTADISFTEPLTIGTLNANTANLNLRFLQGGASTNETQLAVTTFNPNAANGAITLEGVAIRATNGSTLGSSRTLRLINGANLYVGDFYCRAANEVVVSGGSWLCYNTICFGGGKIIVDDSTVWTRTHDIIGQTMVDGHIVFKGTHPLWYHGNTGGYFYSAVNNANVQLDFLVPVGGFAEPPIQAAAGQRYYMGNNGNNPGSAPFTVNVLDESPANFADSVTEVRLIDWNKGINKDCVQQGRLPAYGAGTVTDDSFAWLAADATYPTNLIVTIRGSSHSGDLQISGAPEAFAVPGLSPGYGYAAVAQGNSIQCTAPTEYFNVTPTQRVVCAGWKLYSVDASTLSRTLERTGAGETTCTYANTTGVWHELEWQWQVEYLVTASSGAGGSVAPAAQWIVAGGTATVTATPDAGSTFAAWTNGLPVGADAKSPSLTFTVNEPRVLSAAFTAPVHVATNGDDTTGDGSAANPYATVATGIAACTDGGVVLVHPGPYTLASEITLARDVTVRGATGDPADVTLTATAKSRLFTLNHASARLEALTLTGGAPSAGNGGAVLIQGAGGTLANCMLCNSKVTAWGTSGGGFCIADKTVSALVTHCVVTNCAANESGNGYGDSTFRGASAAAIYAGSVRNCLFAQNGYLHDRMSNQGGAVLITGGTLESSTIAGNWHTFGAGVVANGGMVANCLIGANRSVVNPTGHDHIWLGKSSCFTNCLAEIAINDNCFASSRLFADAASGDWRPAPAAIDAGAAREWMAGATDLAGVARISGPAPDIGCFELDQVDFAAFATPSATAGITPLEVSFAVSAYGAGEGGLSCAWDWNGDGTYDETTATLSASHTYATPGNFSPRVRVTDIASGRIVTDAPGTISVRSAIIYVDASSTTPSFPYATPGTAATTIAAAIEAAVDGCVVEVAANTYSISTELLLDKGVTLRGATGAPENVIVANTKRNGNGSRVIFVNSADARVEGITIQGGYICNNATPFTKNGGGVFVGPCGGTVSNCVIRSCGVWTWGCQGGGLYIHASAANALVTHCVITNCAPTSTTSSTGDGGSALAMYAGCVRNCLFAYNRVSASNSSQTHAFGTVLVGGGTLENCTVVKNDSYNCSGVYTTGGEVRNCAIGLNTSSLASGNANYVVWAGTASCFTSCISPVQINGACAVETESLTYTAPDAGDFSIIATSAAAEGGVARDWMAGATDLAGNPRIRGEAPDIGAYEADVEALSASFDATGSSEGFAPLAVAFSATVANASGTSVLFWDWDGDGTYDEETTSLTASHLFAGCGTYRVGLKVIALNGEYVVPSAVTVKAAPRVIYVDPASEAPAEPYDTWATASTTIQTAVDYAIDGCEIILAATEHVIRTPVSVTKSVWIHGATGNPADTTVRNAVQSGNGSDGTSTCRIFTLTAAGARLSGLTAANGYIVNNTTEYSRDGGGIYVGGAGSVISNCVVRDSRAWHWGTRGGGICVASTATGALVTHCVVSNCNNAIDGGGTVSGTGIFLAAGTVRNCLLTHNNPNNRDSHISYYSIYATGGTVENCTVADNVANGPTGIYAGDGASVTNCLIVGNQAAIDATAVYGGNATRFARCLGDRVLINGECFQADTATVFKDIAAGDFRLPANSPAVNKGARLGWMDGATDLAGRPRLVSKPDIGCYECQSGAGTMIFLR